MEVSTSSHSERDKKGSIREDDEKAGTHHRSKGGGNKKKRRGALLQQGESDLDFYESVQREKSRKADETQTKWARLGGLEKVFKFYDTDPTSEICFGLTVLRQAKDDGPADAKIISSSEEKDHQEEVQKSTAPRDGNSNETDGTKHNNHQRTPTPATTAQQHTNRQQPQHQSKKNGNSRTLTQQQTAVSTFSNNSRNSDPEQIVTYVSSSGIHYDENGEPIMRFFAYDPSVHMKKRALTPGAEYASNHSLKISVARDRLTQQQNTSSSSSNSRRKEPHHAAGGSSSQPPLKTILDARRPYGRYDALSVLEEAATDEKLLSAAHVAFTPCPSPFNATSVRDRNRQEAQQREGKEKGKATAFKKEQRDGEKQRKRVLLTPTPRSPTIEQPQLEEEEYKSTTPPAHRGVSPTNNHSRATTTRGTTTPSQQGGGGKGGGGVAVYGAEGTLGGVVRQKTQRREVSSEHDSVSKVLQAKRTPGAMHLGKVLDRIEGRFQRTLNPLSQKDSQRMLRELELYQEGEESDRRGRDLEHLKRFGSEKPKEVTVGGMGERSQFDLQLTSLGGGGVKPLVRRQRRRYGSQV